MKKIIIYKNNRTKMWGYRDLPISFINIWKVGSIISDESGNGKCEIIDIVDIQDLDKSKIEEYNKYHLKYKSPKVLYKDSPTFNSIVKKMQVFCKLPQAEEGLRSFDIELDDVNFRNIANSFTVIKVNGRKHSTKIIKRNKYNTLSYTYISKYIEEEVKSIEVILSIIDSKYKVSLKNREIILFKSGKEYTLEILHNISISDILNRLPKYIALKRKDNDVYIKNKTISPVSKSESEVKLENVVTDLDKVIKTTLTANASLEEIERKLELHWREEGIESNPIESRGSVASESLDELEQRLKDHWKEKGIKNDLAKSSISTASNSQEELEQRLKNHWKQKDGKVNVEEKPSETKNNKLESQFTKTNKSKDTVSKSIFYIVDEKLNNYELFHKKDLEIVFNSIKFYNEESYLTIDELESELGIKRDRIRNIRNRFLLTLHDDLWFVSNVKESLFQKYEIDSNMSCIEIDDYKMELINRKSNTNFSKEFITCILAVNLNEEFTLIGSIEDVMKVEEMNIRNRHLWKNIYLIKTSIANKFNFDDFVGDINRRMSSYGYDSYSLYFRSYISNFLNDRKNINLLNIVFPIAEKIMINEFDIDLNEHDEILFERRY